MKYGETVAEMQMAARAAATCYLRFSNRLAVLRQVEEIEMRAPFLLPDCCLHRVIPKLRDQMELKQQMVYTLLQ